MSLQTLPGRLFDPRAAEPPWIDTPPLLALAYHRVLDRPEDASFGLAVSRSNFAEQLRRLTRDYRVVHGRGIADLASDDDPRPRVLITFDDGYRDNVEIAAPLLAACGLGAVMFVTSGPLIGQGGPWWEALARSAAYRNASPGRRESLQRTLRLLPTERRLSRMRDLGIDPRDGAELFAERGQLATVLQTGTFEIGAHTRGHASLGCLTPAEIETEIRQNLDDIAGHLGVRPTLFAFPHGSPEDIRFEALEILVRLGFEFGFTMSRGRIPLGPRRSPGTPSAMILPRLAVGDWSGDEFSSHLAHLVAPRPRKIAVLSGISANNLGDDAMLLATVQQLRDMDPQAEIVVLAEDPDRCAPVALELQVPIVRSPQSWIQGVVGGLEPGRSPATAILELAGSLVARRRQLGQGQRLADVPEPYAEGLWHLVAADGVVDCGGANLCSHWKSYFYEKCLDYLVAAGPLHVSGQGIDPFDDRDDVTLLVAALGQAAALTVREEVSLEYLAAVGAPARLAADDASTLDAAGDERRDALLASVGLRPDDRYIAFQYRHYLDYETAETLERFAAYLDELAAVTGQPIVGIPMHFGALDEREHLAALAGKVAATTRFLPLLRHLTPGEAKALFAGASLAAGISYHGAVFSLSSAVPFLGLYRGSHYAQKMQGLARLYEMEALPVPIDEVDVPAFGRQVLALLAEAPAIRAALRRRQFELSGRVTAFRREFVDRLQETTAPLATPGDPRGPVAWGSLRRVTPVSRAWGFDRGLPVDRYYIERYLGDQAHRIRGAVCELRDASYTRRFGGARVSSSDVLDIDAENPHATIVDDLTASRRLPRAAFDCFILTQVLPYLYDCGAALEAVYAALRPGGAMLVTVPSIIKFHREPEDHWRFTPDSLTRLIHEHCPGAACAIEGHGNVLAATAFLHGLAVADLTPGELLYRDPEFPLIVAATVVKSA